MISYFVNCRCPRCKHPLDEVATTIKVCPLCNRELDTHAVWMTRRMPGHINLPGWLTAFGWPLLLMVAGGAIFAATRLHVGAYIFAVGIVYFCIKLFTDGDHP